VLTNRPGARLDGMAGQSLRGQPEAAWGSLHQATPGASQLDASTGEHQETQAPEQAQLAQQALHGEAPHQGCSETAVPEGRDHPDLLGKEAADDSTWWS
jgi:hypothetical protein